MRLVLELPCQDGLLVPGLHVHAIEGRGVAVAELASHNYAVQSPCSLLAHHIPPKLSYRTYTMPFYGPKYAIKRVGLLRPNRCLERCSATPRLDRHLLR